MHWHSTGRRDALPSLDTLATLATTSAYGDEAPFTTTTASLSGDEPSLLGVGTGAGLKACVAFG